MERPSKRLKSCSRTYVVGLHERVYRQGRYERRVAFVWNTPWASRQAIDVADLLSKTLSASRLVAEVDELGDAGAGAGVGSSFCWVMVCQIMV